MNESERLLAAFSNDIFYKEILFTDLHYVPDGENSEVELADLVIYLGDILLAVQLKERNPGDNSGDIETEKKWLNKKGKKAKEQVKETIAQIRLGKVNILKNEKGQSISINDKVEIIPLIVFKNETLVEYDHIIRKHNDKGMDVNCISLFDFEEICKLIVSPIEIIEYLSWREYVYANTGKIDTFFYFDNEENVSITNLDVKENLPLVYLHQKYGISSVKDSSWYVNVFSEHLKALSDHIVIESERNAYYEILLFLAHLDRNEIQGFVERIKLSAQYYKKGEYNICGSLRNVSQNRVIFFLSNCTFIDTDVLLCMVKEKGMEPEKMLQVIVYYENTDEYRVDMNLWSKE